MNKIDKARQEIDRIDSEMAKLFVERMKASEVVAQFKREKGLQVYDPIRENAVIEKNSGLVEDRTLREYYAAFLRNNMELSKKYQSRLLKGMKVAFSGVAGAFADVASKRIFPDGEKVSFGSFAQAYKSVENGECDCCVLPIENSFAGEVGQVIDLIFNGSLYVNGVYSLKITQNLLGIKGSKKEDIKEVVSHPQALAQCAEYLRRMGCKTTESVNTAIAAKDVLARNDRSVAAIASRETAQIYGLEVIDHDINESSANATKFAVLSRSSNERTRSGRMILLFSVKQVAGALAKAINVLGEYGCNMLSLRSRPMKEPAWQCYFFIETECDISDEKLEKMLGELSEQCERLKIAGYYSDTVDLGR